MSYEAYDVVWASKATGATLTVGHAIAKSADREGRAYPSVVRLARMARITERHVRKAINELQRLGVIEIDRGAGPKGKNLYRVRIDLWTPDLDPWPPAPPVPPDRLSQGTAPPVLRDHTPGPGGPRNPVSQDSQIPKESPVNPHEPPRGHAREDFADGGWMRQQWNGTPGLLKHDVALTKKQRERFKDLRERFGGRPFWTDYYRALASRPDAASWTLNEAMTVSNVKRVMSARAEPVGVQTPAEVNG